MAKRSRRADEVIPKLHYRPGVEDPDLEATIVGFYGARVAPSVPCSDQSQLQANNNNPLPADTVIELTVAAEPTDTIAGAAADTLALAPQDTVADGISDTVATRPATMPAATVSDERGRAVAAMPTDTVSPDPQATVAAISESTVAVDRSPAPAGGFWCTEGKEGVFLASRVRRIILAQDALTHAEKSVYDVLWGPENQDRDEQRLASMGYYAIAKAAHVTKMNAKWIVERLIHKGFVKVETLADPLRRIPTRYRVFGYRAALENMKRRNRFHIVRTGNGVLFAHPMSNMPPLAPTATVAVEPTDTGISATSTTVAAEPMVAVGASQSATVSPGKAVSGSASPAKSR